MKMKQKHLKLPGQKQVKGMKDALKDVQDELGKLHVDYIQKLDQKGVGK